MERSTAAVGRNCRSPLPAGRGWGPARTARRVTRMGTARLYAGAGSAVGDGGIGTALRTRGLPPGEPPERWNLEKPDEVAAVHARYAAAGARWSTANSF